MTFPYQDISLKLISDLPTRSQDVFVRRFGLEKSEPETLETVGHRHDITRERVRQIVEDGLRQIQEGIEQSRERERLEAIFALFSSLLAKSGYVKREDLLILALDIQSVANHIMFLLHVGEGFHRHKETEYVHPFWTTKRELMEISPRFLDAVHAHLREKEEALEFEELARVHRAYEGQSIHAETVASLLEVSKYIARSHNGKWGLREWPEVYPRGMRDKAHLALREAGKPLHFVKVAECIEQLQEEMEVQSLSWKKKAVLPQTVHNELIKDPRFVLVGRGTYALKEWGFTPGTVRDVIREILRENGASMTKEEIVEKTLVQRQVKESTILLNLQDKTCFARQGGGYICIEK